MAGNEIIETQTYYTVPENDWVFDDTQKLSYNNPVFLEQCKRKGIKIEDLDTGWVPQHILSEDSEEDEEYEDEEDEESELDEEDLFISKSREIRNSRRHNKSASKDDVMFDIHDDEEEEEEEEDKKAKVTVEKPEINLEDLEAMFGSSESNFDDNIGSSNIDSSHDRIRNELDKISPTTNSSTKIKLNIDKSSNTKQKIKLNIKQK